MSLVDFLIVTPLDQEWAAVREVTRKRMHKKRVGPTTYYLWTHRPHGASSDDAYLVVGAAMPGMGQTKASSFVTTAIVDWKPKNIVMIGIAGGLVPKTVALGDVVVAKTIRGYVLGDVTGRDATFTFRHTQDRTGATLYNAIRALRNEPATYRSWQSECHSAAQELKLQLRRKPELHLSDIASGNKVVKSVRFAKELRRLLGDKTLAVEMEGQGLIDAIYEKAEPTNALMVRGISDHANTAKSTLEKKSKEGWRKFAAANAARLVRVLLNEKPDDPISPPYKLNLRNESGVGLRNIPREHRLLQVGAQNLLFPRLIARSEPTPSLRLSLCCKRSSKPIVPDRSRCILLDAHGRETIISPNNEGVFICPAAETAISLDLFLAFNNKAEEVQVNCSDDFGRNVKATWTSKEKI